LAVKNFSSAVCHFLALFFQFVSKTQFWLQFGINLAVAKANDCVTDNIAENLAFFVSEIHCIIRFQPK